MVEAAFKKLLEKIGVSQSQRSQGSTSHQHVRGLLDGRSQRDASFPWLIDGDFLSGSYARGTKIHPLDDIDVMMVLDGTGLLVIEKGQYSNATVRGSGNTGSPVNQLVYGTAGLISSKMIFEKFRDALREAYPNSQVRKNGQAVNVRLEAYGLGLDIVPCFHILPQDGRREFYYIPQGGESHEWLSTNPKIDQELCDMVDQRHAGKAKQVIKLIKHWNVVHNSGRLQSYHLETVLMRLLYNHAGPIRDFQSAVEFFFENAAPHFQVECPDITTIGGPVDRYLTPEARRLTLAKIGDARRIIKSHKGLGLVLSPTHQLTGWRKIYGESF